MNDDSAILRFYRGGTDARGRRLAEILAWDDTRLEAVHDYIQWLFPLPEPSAFNNFAPVLTRHDIAAFAPVATFAARAANWLNPGNHNHLRLTRILRALSLLGCHDQARALLDALERIAAPTGRVTPATQQYWRQAVA